MRHDLRAQGAAPGHPCGTWSGPTKNPKCFDTPLLRQPALLFTPKLRLQATHGRTGPAQHPQKAHCSPNASLPADEAPEAKRRAKSWSLGWLEPLVCGSCFRGKRSKMKYQPGCFYKLGCRCPYKKSPATQALSLPLLVFFFCWGMREGTSPPLSRCSTPRAMRPNGPSAVPR